MQDDPRANGQLDNSPQWKEPIKMDDDEITMTMQQYKGLHYCRVYSIIVLVLIIASMAFFMYGIVQYQFIDHHIEAIQYTLVETFANAFMIIFSIYIYIRYIFIYKTEGRGRHEPHDCTNFDVYATFSLLWFWMSVLSYLAYGNAGYGVFVFLRMVAIVIPGYIHQIYIRFSVNDEYRAPYLNYLGDVLVYKICCIIFLSLQLFSNVVQLPLNADFFQHSITNVFNLYDGNDMFHFPFIIASVFGRPFVCILNFHLLILYLTWLVNGDKPKTHHNLDLFALTMHDQSLNALFGVIVMLLYVIDVVFNHHIWYRSTMLFIYLVSAGYHFYFLCVEGRKTQKRMTIVKKKHEAHARIDAFTIFESSFVLLGGVLACWLYIANIYDFEKTFSTFSELLAWSLFMVSQYIFVIFIQLDYVYGRKLLMRRSTQKMLSVSALISAVSITFLFSFEYTHFVEILTENEHDNDHVPVSMTISYSLFWCLIEYFIWSFVSINHMLHHVEHVEHMAHVEECERHRVSIIVHEMTDQRKKQKQLQKDLGVTTSPSMSSINSVDPNVVVDNVMRSNNYVNAFSNPFTPTNARSRRKSYLFVEEAPLHDYL